jgi:Sucrase/ferredoxin-like
MGEPLALRCATESLAREEPLYGTASRVQRWMVVEQPGAWGRDALAHSGLDPTVAATLVAEARRHRVRVLLARPAGFRIRHRAGPRRVFLAHSGTERTWLRQVEVPFDQAAALLDVDLGALAFPDPPAGPGIGPGPESLFLVCTNGRHDPCCADLGRPVIRALMDAAAADVWEVSHVGGDRFAANVVCLPDGTYYGRVPPERAAALLADHRGGTLDLACYRGRSAHPPLVQAAEWFARRPLDERRADGVGVLSTEHRDDGTVAVLVQARGGAALEVVVRPERAAPAQLTCHVPRESAPFAYRLVALAPA